ncbi:hypothetical protein [Peptostreptococcus canis]|uniref:Uncharacterized protein n=1 Tax=Peptostreptococcus canis TaxID=1159213 RepID=A0ABR6TJ53_9FIRM|nr:hypothetical protein [Peptostreptococcus canis]MBC2575163.1 hypothetical protein [Peptostreptococcus canis]MBP1997662.1 CHASE3 domain sensor protein [Peptostreptococcus canis]
MNKKKSLKFYTLVVIVILLSSLFYFNKNSSVDDFTSTRYDKNQLLKIDIKDIDEKKIRLQDKKYYSEMYIDVVNNIPSEYDFSEESYRKLSDDKKEQVDLIKKLEKIATILIKQENQKNN